MHSTAEQRTGRGSPAPDRRPLRCQSSPPAPVETAGGQPLIAVPVARPVAVPGSCPAAGGPSVTPAAGMPSTRLQAQRSSWLPPSRARSSQWRGHARCNPFARGSCRAVEGHKPSNQAWLQHSCRHSAPASPAHLPGLVVMGRGDHKLLHLLKLVHAAGRRGGGERAPVSGKMNRLQGREQAPKQTGCNPAPPVQARTANMSMQ